MSSPTFSFASFVGVNNILISVCISLIHNEVEHIFAYLLAISVSSSGNIKHLFMFFAHLLTGYFGFGVLSSISSLEDLGY